MTTIILTPAYGRDYKASVMVWRDLMADKDFIMEPMGKPINRPQLLESFPGAALQCRYGKLRKVCFFEVKDLA